MFICMFSGGQRNTRFVVYNPEEAKTFIERHENESTKKKTKSDISQFTEFLHICCQEFRKIEEIPIPELDSLFARFLLGTRKVKTHEEYEPSTLRGFMCSLDRYLRQHGCDYTLIKNSLFPQSNAALVAKQKNLKTQGLGNRPNEADELTDTDIEQLFHEGILGIHNPEALINLLHLNFSLVLGMRGGKEQKQLKWGDIQIEVDEDGDEYLVHKRERATKTRTGQDIRNVRKFKPKAWNSDLPERCPVNAYRLYASKRPPSMCEPDSPFFLAVNCKSPNKGQEWFKKSAMGINHIYSLTKKMIMQCKSIDTSRKLTNHSVRKHLLQKCVDMNLPPTETVQISGHKNLQSVNNYSKMNENRQKQVSKSLVAGNHEKFPQTTESCGTLNLPTYRSGTAGHGQSGNNFSYSQQAMASYFGSGTMISGGTFIFNAGAGSCTSCPSHSQSDQHKLQERPRKFRRILPIDDSSSDEE